MARLLEVTEVAPEHERSARHGGVVGMSGPLHVETVAFRDGEARVYPSDVFRKPLQAGGIRGEVEITSPGSASVRLPLEPGPRSEYLGARGAVPFESKTVEVTVRLAKPHEFLMTYALVPRTVPAASRSL